MNKVKYMCPLLTLFNDDKTIDYDAMYALAERLIAGGVDGMIVLGSSGEFYSMDDATAGELAKRMIARVGGRVPVYVGTGRMTPERTTKFSRHALGCGADGVIVVGPYYIGASQEGVEAFYDEVARNVDGDIIIYNYPERTGHDVGPSTIKRLLGRHKHIIGIKDTVMSAQHTVALVTELAVDFPAFEVYTGYDCNFAGTVLAGGSGCIGALSNIAVAATGALVRAVRDGDLKALAAAQRRINRLMPLYTLATPFMPIFKAILREQGINNDGLCLPPSPPISSLAAEMDAALAIARAQEIIQGR